MGNLSNMVIIWTAIAGNSKLNQATLGIAWSNTCCSTNVAPGKALFKRNMERWNILLMYYSLSPSPPWVSVTCSQWNKEVAVKSFAGRFHRVTLIILCSCSQQLRKTNTVDSSFTSQAFCLMALVSIFLGDSGLGGVCSRGEVWVRRVTVMMCCVGYSLKPRLW